MKRAEKIDPDHLAGPMGRGAAAGPPRRDRQGGRRLQVVRRPLQRPAGGDRPRRRCAADRRPGRRALLPGHGAGRGAERLAQRRDQRDLRGGAAGRPRLLAGALARGPAVPLGLQRGRRRAASWPGPSRSTRSRAEILVTLGQNDLQSYQPGRGPGQGRARAGDQPPLRPGVHPAGRPEHHRRAVRRRQRGGAEGGGREPARRRGPGAGWRPRIGCWSTPSARPPPSWPPWRSTPGRRPSTPRWASGWPTAASTTRPSAPSCWPPPPTRTAPTPRSAWACSTCRSAARPRPAASSTPPSPPTRSTSAPTT